MLGDGAAREYEVRRHDRAARPLSTAPEEDLLILFERTLFTWLIADGDMHMKNLALLKIADPGAAQFREVRLAPLHDAVTTRGFPHLDHDRLALKLNGKDDRLDRADFRKKPYAPPSGRRLRPPRAKCRWQCRAGGRCAESDVLDRADPA